MYTQLHYLAALSQIDRRLGEYEEDLGDLPLQISKLKDDLGRKKTIFEESQNILDDVRKFSANSKVTLRELKEKEEKLSKQQFLVRNNKEFDAITKEIAHIKNEFNRISQELKNVGIKDENLVRMLEQQKKDVEEAKNDLEEKEEDYESIKQGQSEDVKLLMKERNKIIKKLEHHNIDEYERIRHLHRDAVVGTRKNSCTGCYSAVPPQKIVEMRNNLDRLFSCENCGRILVPEEIDIDGLVNIL